MPLIISIVGYSDSGKTRLLEKIIPLLKAKGYSAGVIKHSGHEFLLDQPGKDTHKLRQAGADGVVLVGSGQVGFWGKMDKGKGSFLDQIEQAFFSDRDVVLCEGFKKEGKPKIAVLTEGKEQELFEEMGENIIATVGPAPFRADLPHFRPDDFKDLVEMLEDRFLKCRRPPSQKGLPGRKNRP